MTEQLDYMRIRVHLADKGEIEVERRSRYSFTLDGVKQTIDICAEKLRHPCMDLSTKDKE